MSCVYLLECKETGDKYIGSTTMKLNQRIYAHKAKCKRFDNGLISDRCSSFEIIRRNNYTYKALETFTHKDLIIMRQAENKWIQELNPINYRKKATITPEEKKERDKRFHKEWYEKNKEACAERDRLYRENNKEACAERARLYREKNKETIAEKASEKVECECGVFVCKKKLVRHKKTDKHKSLLEQQN